MWLREKQVGLQRFGQTKISNISGRQVESIKLTARNFNGLCNSRRHKMKWNEARWKDLIRFTMRTSMRVSIKFLDPPPSGRVLGGRRRNSRKWVCLCRSILGMSYLVTIRLWSSSMEEGTMELGGAQLKPLNGCKFCPFRLALHNICLEWTRTATTSAILLLVDYCWAA